MSGNTKKGPLVPQLRFPEFRNAGEGNHAPLGRLFSERQEAGFTNLPLLSLMDKEGIVPQEETNRKNNSSENKSKYLRVLPGDIAYNTMRMWEGRSAYVGLEGLISPAYTVCVPAEGISSSFFSYHFKTTSLIRQFKKYSQGLVKDTLNLKFEAFSRIEIPYPSEAREQQKIAECLSSLDEMIAAETRKLDILKSHKKGLMQLIFPHEGETVPQLRFPEFRDEGGWEFDLLGNIFDTTSGGTPSRSVKEYWNGCIPWITTSLVDFGIITRADEFISEVGLKNSAAKIFPRGTVLIAMYGQGKTRGQVALLSIEAATNQACAAILPRKEIDPNFVFLNLASRYEEMRQLSNSGGQENLSQSLIRELPFSYPSNPAEQRMITTFLTSIDNVIDAQAQRIESLKSHKNGLMQQLFPVLGETSA